MAKITIDKVEFNKEVSRVPASAESKYFCKQDEERSVMPFNNLSQILKYLEVEQPKVCSTLVRLNDGKRLTVSELKRGLSLIFKQLEF